MATTKHTVHDAAGGLRQVTLATFTGASAVVSAAHRGKDGVMHGHTWEVRAWWPEDDCAVARQHELKQFLSAFDHTVLGDDIAWGEALAKAVALGLDCARVEVNRPLEGIFAFVERVS